MLDIKPGMYLVHNQIKIVWKVLATIKNSDRLYLVCVDQGNSESSNLGRIVILRRQAFNNDYWSIIATPVGLNIDGD